MYTSSDVQKAFAKRNFTQSKFSLPAVSSRARPLRTFLSVEDLKRAVQTSGETRFFQSAKIKKRKVFITMNEELTGYTKQENSFKLSGSEEQNDSIDERKTLLYDKFPVNRQKAAANICKVIVEDVKSKFSSKNLFLPAQPKKLTKVERYVKELVTQAENFEEFHKRFEVIHQKSQETYIKTFIKKPEINELKEVRRESENHTFTETVQRINKKEKTSREESTMQFSDIKELFSETQEFFLKHKMTFTSIFQTLPKFQLSEKPATYFSSILQRLELSSPSMVKHIRNKKFFVCFTQESCCLPNLRLESDLILYIVLHLNCWSLLTKVDLSYNNIGDKSVALLVSCLSQFSPRLEILDLSFTQCSTLTALVFQNVLKLERFRLQTLKLEGNLLKDEGIYYIALGLMPNLTLLHLNITDNQLQHSGGIAISKLIRINRALKALNMSRSEISGISFKEICRSLIINTELRSITLNYCKLTDSDSKEIGHMLNRNGKLQQIYLAYNKLTQAGLEWFKYGLTRNKTLVHLALSGNEGIKLEGLEELKQEVRLGLDVDIGKEEDFFKSTEGAKFKIYAER